ncbi:hypothetical protein PESH_05165 [Pasteurella multocida subsp. multocida]|nr:hypothetical protein PESH_05165 [Pasteurella multocida subsp. multocida]
MTTDTIPKPFEHQKKATEFWLVNPRMCNFSDPGTGKTRATLDAIKQRGGGGGGGGRAVVGRWSSPHYLSYSAHGETTSRNLRQN